MRTITIGGLDTTQLTLRDGLPLPVLDDVVPVYTYAADCLKQAVAERRGVALCSPAGGGKTLSTQRVLRRFQAAEEARCKKEATYIPRRAVYVSTVRADTPRALYGELFHAAFDEPLQDRLRGRVRGDEQLRDDLINRCTEERVVAFVVDEAQTLTATALAALRDLMAMAESKDVARFGSADTADGAAEEAARPAGIGVLLVGTFALERTLAGAEELGRRWLRVERVGLMAANDVPAAMQRMLPAFAAGAVAMGTAWPGMVREVLQCTDECPVAALVDITRAYVRRASEQDAAVKRAADLPWDEDLLRLVGMERATALVLGEAA